MKVREQNPIETQQPMDNGAATRRHGYRDLKENSRSEVIDLHRRKATSGFIEITDDQKNLPQGTKKLLKKFQVGKEFCKAFIHKTGNNGEEKLFLTTSGQNAEKTLFRTSFVKRVTGPVKKLLGFPDSSIGARFYKKYFLGNVLNRSAVREEGISDFKESLTGEKIGYDVALVFSQAKKGKFNFNPDAIAIIEYPYRTAKYSGVNKEDVQNIRNVVVVDKIIPIGKKGFSTETVVGGLVNTGYTVLIPGHNVKNLSSDIKQNQVSWLKPLLHRKSGKWILPNEKDEQGKQVSKMTICAADTDSMLTALSNPHLAGAVTRGHMLSGNKDYDHLPKTNESEKNKQEKQAALKKATEFNQNSLNQISCSDKLAA